MRFTAIAVGVLAGSLFCTANAQVSSQTPQAKAPLPSKVTPKPPINPNVRPQPVIHALNGSDNCASAATNDAISGPGTFAINSTGATTGSPAMPCGSGGTDVWFYWTATSTGTANVTTCGQVSADSVLAAWADGSPAGTCPTTNLACNDDSCGLQSSISFPVTNGTSYFIQAGSFAGGAGYSGTMTISIAGPATNDACTSPTTVTGVGAFPFSTLGATTGAEGQTEPSCLFFGSSAIYNDVWFRWTAPFTGSARIETCAGATFDTKIAVYGGTGCPTGAALACNDDACALQSRASLPVTMGTDYIIQLGAYGSGVTGSGTFMITQFTAATNDDCSMPTNVVGNGPHSFDTTAATTGTQGQSEPLCFAFGSSNIYNDVWFTWTAGATGTYEISLCATGGHPDTRVAVYNGSGCPTGAAIACNDDSCGLISAACFNATAGQIYTFQIGAYGTTQVGTGSFQLSSVPPPAGGCAPKDDGTSENSVGLTAGGAVGWLVGFGGIGESNSISAISTTYGTPLFPGGYGPTGPVTVAVWDDPNDDGDPTDGVLLATATATVSAGSIDTDVFQTVTLTSPVTANGIFFVGAVVNHPAGQFPAPLDQSSGGGGCASGPGSWVFGDTTGTANLMTLSANNVPPASAAGVGLPGNWLLRVACAPGSTGTPFCLGDGTGTACPCGNSGAAGHGCENSFSTGGALLVASGSASVMSDTVKLTGTSMPPTTTCLFFQGTAPISVAFGDGLRCAGGTVTRLGSRPVSGGMREFGFGVAGDPLVSVMGVVPAGGGARHYQIWYRNVAAFCTPAGFNLSNGLTIMWAP